MNIEVAIAVVPQAAYPDPARVIARARDLRVSLGAVAPRAAAGDDAGPADQCYELEGGGDVLIRLVPAPLPDQDGLVLGPTAPTAEALAAAPAHLVIAARDLPGDARRRDLALLGLAAAVAAEASAVGVVLAHRRSVHRGPVFVELAAEALPERALPAPLVLDLVVDPDGEDRMALLTMGMTRYGRDELLVTCPLEGVGAFGFLYEVADWLLGEPPPMAANGVTIGRTDDEALELRRVPHPRGEGPDVIRLDLPT